MPVMSITLLNLLNVLKSPWPSCGHQKPTFQKNRSSKFDFLRKKNDLGSGTVGDLMQKVLARENQILRLDFFEKQDLS